MQRLGLNEIREKFLSFYESKGHYRLPSFPLVPKGDSSLLLINSGMAPLKPFFTGQAEPPSRRVTTCQKCIRTPDIERVGKTARHGTFFEMLGNFSFGNYFKREATAWAWEFCTKVMEMPIDRLWVSIYEDDDEAFDIWTKEVGVSPDHIVRLGREDNFWEIGTGPCGPCSEIYFDRGEEYGCGKDTCAVGCDCDRYVEFWNLVFTQFDSDGKGNYSRLAHPNIDTGMGLERLACISQGVDNLFEVDTVAEICEVVSGYAGIKYKEDVKKDVSLRVITDHVRGTTFMIADGVIPSNEGRGYVLRRLLRRAARHGKLLGINKPFLSKVCETVIKNYGGAYPELVEKRDYIKKIILLEEERFNETVDQGLNILNAYISEMKKENVNEISGEKAFKLYDTFGFPIDLTREIMEEQGLTVDEDGFNKMMAEQKARARAARAAMGDAGWSESVLSKLDKGIKTDFVGYAEEKTDAKILAIIKDNEIAEAAGEGDMVTLLLDRTTFYAESGGQVGDSGVITKDGATVTVTDCKKVNGRFLHLGEVTEGSIMVGDTVNTAFDLSRRRAIMRNHSAAHLLQAALRRELGTHVEQAGSYVDEHRVRFDFTHMAAMTEQEIKNVENAVNESILAGLEVDISEMPIDEAKKLGAMALFGEKYGSVVRVVRMGDVSTEFCGGCHVRNTARVGLFKILSESSVASGVRRIEGTTGFGVLEILKEKQQLIDETASALKSGTADIAHKATTLVAETKELTKELDSMKAKLAAGEMDDIMKKAANIGGILVAAARVDADGAALRTMGDAAKDKYPASVAVFAGVKDGKGSIVVSCGKDAVAKGIKAGNLVKELAALTGGSGGGRPDSAMGSIKDAEKLTDALGAAAELVKSMLK
ncbi:MAG: alanine--tRNA ligase [Bacillota bacterium]|nr:alanine--tRNA ligase [Bacillota bacterium]